MRRALWLRLHGLALLVVGAYCFGWPASMGAKLWHPIPLSGDHWPRMLGVQWAMFGFYLLVLVRTGDDEALRWSVGLRLALPAIYLGLYLTHFPAYGLLLACGFELSMGLGFFALGRADDAKAPVASGLSTPSQLHQVGLGLFLWVEGLACFFAAELWSRMTFGIQPPEHLGWVWLFGLQSCFLGVLWCVMVWRGRQEVLFATLIGRVLVALGFLGFAWSGVAPGGSRFPLLAVALCCSSLWSGLELTGRLHLDRRLFERS